MPIYLLSSLPPPPHTHFSVRGRCSPMFRSRSGGSTSPTEGLRGGSRQRGSSSSRVEAVEASEGISAASPGREGGCSTRTLPTCSLRRV